MKIAFLYPSFESLGVEYLAAVAAERGHKSVLAFDPGLFEDSFIHAPGLAGLFSAQKRVVKEVAESKPDLIAFSVLSSNVHWFRSMGKAIREQIDAPIIAGNIHITSAPREALELEFLDAVVMGEGERTFGLILDSLESTGKIDPEIPGLGTAQDGEVRLNPIGPLIEDLDGIPWPMKSLYDGTPVDCSMFYGLIASRGCPYSCSFCNGSVLKKLYREEARNYLRVRSVDNVIDELREAKKRYPFKFVNFFDETFAANKAHWLEEFVDKYPSAIDLPYLVCTNPNLVSDDYARMLGESGCRKVDMGVQTLDEGMRKEVLNRTETTEKVRAAFSNLKKYGVAVSAENILNAPGETEEALVKMARFYNLNRPTILKAFWLSYFPGIKIIDVAREKGILTDSDIDRINHGEEIEVPYARRYPVPHMQLRFYLLLSLTRIFPPNWLEFIIEKKIYRGKLFGLISRMDFLVRFSILFRLAVCLTPAGLEREFVLLQMARKYIFYLILEPAKRLLGGNRRKQKRASGDAADKIYAAAGD